MAELETGVDSEQSHFMQANGLENTTSLEGYTSEWIIEDPLLICHICRGFCTNLAAMNNVMFN